MLSRDDKLMLKYLEYNMKHGINFDISAMNLGYIRKDIVEKERQKLIDELTATNKKISDECHKLVDSLEKAQKENAELKEKLTAIRNAKDKYDMSNNKSVIRACGAEYFLFCDLERILEDWQEDDKLTIAKEIIKSVLPDLKHYLWLSDEYNKGQREKLIKRAEDFISEVEK